MSRALHRLARRPGVLPCFALEKRGFVNNYADRPRRKDQPGFVHHMINGAKIFRVECGRMVEEWKEKLKMDKPKYYPGDIVPQYNFREQKDRDLFQIMADSDYNLGYSKGEFVGTRESTGLFKGFLDTRVPDDGKTVRAGYVVLQGSPATRSFLREVYLEWQHWTHLVIRCRGDGRHYNIHLHAYEEDDMSTHIIFSYPLYTRGGPYWQITTIPFSKFLITYKGTIQDRQHRIELNRITKVGIALMDKMPGPFELEIDYIACAMSRSDEDEEFAYETYETPNNYSNAFGMK